MSRAHNRSTLPSRIMNNNRQYGYRSSRAVRRWMRNQGTVLLNQQIWCWGQDIRHREGNLLLAYGFRRHRPPANTHGSSCYELQVNEQTAIRLWGFGFFYEHHELGVCS